jgi:putative Holliday junction resolvase
VRRPGRAFVLSYRVRRTIAASLRGETAADDEGSRRVLALDYGRARIGVAASDPTRRLAFPHSVVANDAPPNEVPAELLGLVLEVRPAEVVIGIPLNMDGSRGGMAEEAAEFGRQLAERSGVRVVEWDERLSTARAERTLRESRRRGRARRQKGRTDAVAAAHMLQSYLDRSDV